MNLEQLRRRFRVLAKDTVEPFLYADDDIADWLTDAEAQACMRGRLLLDDYTPSVCVVPVVAGTHSYNLHPKLYELVLVRFKATGDTRSAPVASIPLEPSALPAPPYTLAPASGLFPGKKFARLRRSSSVASPPSARSRLAMRMRCSKTP